VAYFLSDLSAGVTGQVVRVDGDNLQLISHPAVSLPVAVHSGWDVLSVSRQFEADFRRRLLPTGVHGFRISAPVTTGGPGWAAPVQDPAGQA
jgi:hypothetical protein